MKKVFTLFAFVASLSIAAAQTSPKPATKAETKKECKKGDKCCSRDSQEKTASVQPKNKSSKKN
jgi:hypothetical protein